ncbi:hypothetical protein OIDMADRAFT_61908 [Oidiodendron maius Zn]|uniref:Ubiquitin 3 binding protein But2 C-terminal domain-containing protein n=1 Tax=Oidiodendron maius (strain Zn) TaxID=913774 RepID=A0A0C3C2M5_OIDMZ|nr:hypothetical protein OIDMADRAFT_61908 [Oidiodendron maius Zn]
MLLRFILLCLLAASYAIARTNIITIPETSCMVDFRANFRLSTSQTPAAQSSIASNDLILEWEQLLPEFTGYLSYSGSLMCMPTAKPSVTLPISVMSDSNSAEIPVTEFPWSWSCVPDSCATVTSLGSKSQLVVNYGSGGPHWSFTVPSRVVEDGLFTYAYSSACTTTTDFMTLYMPNITTTSTAPSSIMTTAAATTQQPLPTTTQQPPLLPSTGIVIAAYTVCPWNEEDWIAESCGYQWEIYPIDNVLQTTTSFSYPGCTPESALMISVTSTLLMPSAIPALGGFDVDGKSDCTYNSGPTPGLSCVTASTLKCVVCPQPYPRKTPVGVCGGIFVVCPWIISEDESPVYGTEAYCIW